MPPRIRKIPGPDGTQIEVTEMPFQPGTEHWNEYMVDDGSVVRVKLVVSEVLKVSDQYDVEGNPVYIVKSQNILVVNAPEKLRRRSGDA